MRVLDDGFRITCGTLVVAFAAITAPSRDRPCGTRPGRLRLETKWASGPNRHGCRRHQHAIKKSAARDRLVQSKDLVGAGTMGHFIRSFLQRPKQAAGPEIVWNRG